MICPYCIKQSEIPLSPGKIKTCKNHQLEKTPTTSTSIQHGQRFGFGEGRGGVGDFVKY
jgi:hypothetical protein